MSFAFVRKCSLNSVKIYGTIIVFLTIQASADTVAIIGGIDLTKSGPAYAALVSSSGALTSLVLTGNAAACGIISSVSMNSSGNSLIGGQGQTGSAYAALVSSSGSVTSFFAHGIRSSKKKSAM